MLRTESYKRRFLGSYTPGTSAGVDELLKKDTSSSGSPTLTTTSDGLKFTLANNNEVEVLTLYFGDVLSFDIDDIASMEFTLKGNAALLSNETFVAGLASAQNDDPDAIAAAAWFKIVGSASPGNFTLLCESTDGVTDNYDKPTGISLPSSGTILHRRLGIYFGEEVATRSPPSTSKGKQVVFRAQDANGVWRRVADNVAFDMSGYSSGLQPFFQLQKASGTGVPAISLQDLEIKYRQV